MVACLIGEQDDNENFHYVDIAVANEGKVNPCSKCLNTYNKQVSICPICKLHANNFPQDYDPYHRTDFKHTQEKPHGYIGEPCVVNLNSMEVVKTVLNHVSVASNVSDNEDERKWTFIINNGVPYIYASTIQDSYVVCSICKK